MPKLNKPPGKNNKSKKTSVESSKSLPPRLEVTLWDTQFLLTKWLVPFTSHLGHLKREQPYLGDLLTMVIYRLLTGMILQVWSVVSVGKDSIEQLA